MSRASGCEQAAGNFLGKCVVMVWRHLGLLPSPPHPCSVLLPRNSLGRAKESTSILHTLPLTYAYIIRPPNGVRGWNSLGRPMWGSTFSRFSSPILPSFLFFPFVLRTPYSSICQLLLQPAFPQPQTLPLLIPSPIPTFQSL